MVFPYLVTVEVSDDTETLKVHIGSESKLQGEQKKA